MKIMESLKKIPAWGWVGVVAVAGLVLYLRSKSSSSSSASTTPPNYTFLAAGNGSYTNAMLLNELANLKSLGNSSPTPTYNITINKYGGGIDHPASTKSSVGISKSYVPKISSGSTPTYTNLVHGAGTQYTTPTTTQTTHTSSSSSGTSAIVVHSSAAQPTSTVSTKNAATSAYSKIGTSLINGTPDTAGGTSYTETVTSPTTIKVTSNAGKTYTQKTNTIFNLLHQTVGSPAAASGSQRTRSQIIAAQKLADQAYYQHSQSALNQLHSMGYSGSANATPASTTQSSVVMAHPTYTPKVANLSQGNYALMEAAKTGAVSYGSKISAGQAAYVNHLFETNNAYQARQYLAAHGGV